MTLTTMTKNFVIIGCGGIGANLAIQMYDYAEKILIIDNDVIELSNLNRIPIPIGNIGKQKVTAIADTLKDQNTNKRCKIIVYNGCVNNYEELKTAAEAVGINNLDSFIVVDCRDTLNPLVMFKEIEWKLTYDGGSMVCLSHNPQKDCEKTLSIGDGYQVIPSFYLAPFIQCDLFIEFISEVKSRTDIEKVVRTTKDIFEITDKVIESKVDIKKFVKNYRART